MAWRDRRISFRTLAILVLGWGVFRFLIAVLMAPQVTIFAPDEAGYAALVGAVADGENWIDYSYGYGAAIWPQGRSLLAPASWLALLGAPAFTSLRVVSVMYSTGAAVLMLGLCWIAMRYGRSPSEASGPRLISWPVAGLAIFVLMPSHALWGTLGLREAATEFWVLASVSLAALLLTLARKWWHKTLVALGIVAAVALAYQSRGYMAVALSLSLASGVIWLGRERPRVSLTLATAVVAGTIAGLSLSLPGTSSPGTSSPGTSSPGTSSPGTIALEGVQRGVEAAQEALNPDTYLERGSYQREVSAQYANSDIAVDSCSGVPDPRSLRLCEITRLPGAAFAVMFRPLWPLDVPTNWSTMAVVASVENLAWLVTVGAALWVLMTRRAQLPRVLGIAIVYGTLLIAGMAALEGNFGTAFRHKSNVLWVFCMVLLLAGLQRGTLRLSRSSGDAPADELARSAGTQAHGDFQR